MKTAPEGAEKIEQVLDENASLRATVAERDEEIARLREHLKIQEREIAALQAENAKGGKQETASVQDRLQETQRHEPERKEKERRMIQVVRRER